MKYMLMKYASRAAIDAMAGKETAASPAGTPEEVRAMGEFMGRWTDELAEPGEFVDAAGVGRTGAYVVVKLRRGSWEAFTRSAASPGYQVPDLYDQRDRVAQRRFRQATRRRRHFPDPSTGRA